MRNLICFLIFLLLAVTASSSASPATEAPNDLKGFFGESLVDDIYQAAGRSPVPFKMDPNMSGPDRIYKLADGTIEIHEVKTYSSWPGKAAMKTTAGGVPTYELSQRWCETWVQKTMSSPTATSEAKAAAAALAEAIKTGKIKFFLDEINLTTQQFRNSEILQIGFDDVRLSEKMGPTRLQRFEQYFSRKSKDFLRLKMGNLANIMTSPGTNASWRPISRKDQCALIPDDSCRNAGVKKIKIFNGLMTLDGRLLVSVKTGAKSGLMVFAADSGHAVYQYWNGDILKPELEQKIADAADRGAFVGTCVGVTVFLGATPAGWVVLAVSIGSYFVVDTALQVWHEYQDRKYLTADDLRGWGITLDTPLDPPPRSVLEPKQDTVLDPVSESLLF